MQIHSSSNPAIAAAEQLTQSLQQSHDTPTLLLLSGGSALSVLDHINPAVFRPSLTVMMGDDRYSNEPAVNNYTQLTQTAFFNSLAAAGATTISTRPDEAAQSATAFSYGLNKLLMYYFETNPNAQVIALLGMGPDGHTASIFPQSSESEFNDIYQTTDLYVATPAVGEPAVERVSITPYFIKKYIVEILLFAAGESKLPKLKELIHKDNQIHKLPVSILSQHPNTQIFTDCDVHSAD